MNKSNHIKVNCPYCSYEACRSCCETYILGQSTPKCMEGKCGKEWSRKFLVKTFSKTFLNGSWKAHKEKLLLDKEIALLPATQVVVESIKKREIAVKEAKEILKLIRELKRRRAGLLTMDTNTQAVRNAFVRACPSADCRGYLSSQWKCGLCDKWTCPDCHVIKEGGQKDENHVCNADDLATAKLLDKDTKQCPKCATGIFKIAGCDQMWCTQCHTAFSWATGRIETHIHNPHFFEWQRINGTGNIPRVPGDILCGREITHQTPEAFRNILRGNEIAISKWGTKNRLDIYNQVISISRNLIHLNHVQVNHYRVNNVVDNNQDLRVKYMRNEITIDVFKVRIHRDNKKYEMNREISDILAMFIQTVTDIIYRALAVISTGQKIFKVINTSTNLLDSPEKEATRKAAEEIEMNTLRIFEEMEPIRNYANECLVEISQTYGLKQKHIIPLTTKNAADVLVTYAANHLHSEHLR